MFREHWRVVFCWFFSQNENKHKSLNTKHCLMLAFSRKKKKLVSFKGKKHVMHTNENLSSLQQNYKSNHPVSPAPGADPDPVYVIVNIIILNSNELLECPL